MSQSGDLNQREMGGAGNMDLEANNSMGGSHGGDRAGDENKESSASGFQDLYGENTDNDWTRQVREMMQARFGCSLEEILNRVQQRRHRNVHCDPLLSPALSPTPASSPSVPQDGAPAHDVDTESCSCAESCSCQEDPSLSSSLAKQE